MLIEIHMIQNHAPANLNRDDLGAPKTCYFGGVLRQRISSQCLKRSIRLSDEFKSLCGGIRTRRLAQIISEGIQADQTTKEKTKKLALKMMKACKIESKKNDESDMLIYTTHDAVVQMVDLLKTIKTEKDIDSNKVEQFKALISQHVHVPDMALTGRMLETGEIKDTAVEASLQAAHAISTHAARPEIDYYVAADDIPGEDHGAGFVDEAMFASACFYKYFSIHWEVLVKNLGGNEKLAAHTLGAFVRAAAIVTPSGKQNSFAAHNPPDGILVELRRSNSPISYANAFAEPVERNQGRGLVSQSIAQLAQYVHDMDVGYGHSDGDGRLWYSPNLRHPLCVIESRDGKNVELEMTRENIPSLDGLIEETVKAVGQNWADVQSEVVNSGAV